MEKRIAVATLVAFALLTLGFLPSPLRAGAGGTNRPFEGNAQGAVTGVTSDGALIAESTGTATHLGAYSRIEHVFVNGPDISGTIVFTAANGDQLRATFTGEFTSPTTAEGIYIFGGGTGRFANATGTASFDATTTTTPDGVIHLAVTFDGNVSY